MVLDCLDCGGLYRVVRKCLLLKDLLTTPPHLDNLDNLDNHDNHIQSRQSISGFHRLPSPKTINWATWGIREASTWHLGDLVTFEGSAVADVPGNGISNAPG